MGKYMRLLAQAAGSVADWALAALALLGIGGGGGLLGVGARVNQRTKDNETRSKQNERRLTGDDENPNHGGLMDMAQETRQRVEDVEHKIDKLDRKVERQHEAVLEELEDS